MRPLLGLRLTPKMASSDRDAWFPEQLTGMSSLDAMIASRSSHEFTPSLPPLPEQDWELSWNETMFIQNSYAGFKQASTTVVGTAANESTPPKLFEELN